MKKAFTLLALLFCISLRAQMPCPKGINVTDASELNKLYTATNGAEWNHKDNWNNLKTLQWKGVGWIVNAGECRVDSLSLKYNDLITNNLPNINLPFLRYLDLSDNSIGGAVPDFDLPNLEYLNLNNYTLYPIDITDKKELPNLSKLKKLKYLNLSNRENTKGMPNFDLPLLEVLNLFNCSITGEIPAWNLPNLKDLNLDCDTLIQGLAANFNLPKLRGIGLYHTKNLKSEYAFFAKAFPNLKYMYITGAPKISYTNSDFLFPNLVSLGAGENGYKGSFSIVNMPKLKDLQLNKNQLNQLQFSNDNVIEEIQIKHNIFSGKLDFIAGFKDLEYIYATNNQFDTLSITLLNPKLRSIDLYKNKFQYSLEHFSSLPSLKYLDLSENQIRDTKNKIDFGELYSLNVSNNRLTFNGLNNFNQKEKAIYYFPQADIALFQKEIFASLKMLSVKEDMEGSSYDWRKKNEFDGSSKSVLIGVNNSFLPIESGKYYCVITNPKYPRLVLSSETQEVQVTDNQDNNFAVFPSLNDGNFAVFINTPFSQEIAIKIYNEQGQLLSQKNQTYPQSPIIDFNLDLNNGIYFVEIQSNNKRVTRKIKVQH